MSFQSFLKHERRLWHRHFGPSMLAGAIVAVITLLFEMTVSNVILFASIGASAMIVTHSRSHHLTRLHTTIVAYIVAIVFSLIIYWINTLVLLPLPVNVFLSVFIVGLAIFLVDAFHPPAISASLSFILLARNPFDLVWLFAAILILLVIIRLGTYLFSQHLSLREFWTEFRKKP